jgi:xanthine/uracil/vitamin C permease (AzgA family)
MTSRPFAGRPLSPTPLRPAAYAGIAAALVTIGTQVVIRMSPNAESLVTGGHFVISFVLFVMGGALAARLGGDGWRAGLFAGLLDALIGHSIAFLIAPVLDPSRVNAPPGVEVTPQLVAAMHLWSAVLGAAVSVAFAVGGGALGGWYARKTLGGRR